MTAKPTPEDLERQNLLARINELEQILNNERTVGRQKMLDGVGADFEHEFLFFDEDTEKTILQLNCPVEKMYDYIRNWKPRGE